MDGRAGETHVVVGGINGVLVVRLLLLLLLVIGVLRLKLGRRSAYREFMILAGQDNESVRVLGRWGGGLDAHGHLRDEDGRIDGFRGESGRGPCGGGLRSRTAMDIH
jgi:hypothetical protein